jgi:hypothetical protein
VPYHSPNVAEDGTPGHRHERPEDWGWHGGWGRWARVGGWLCVALLIGLNFTTRYNRVESVWLYGVAALLVALLIRDWYRRKNAWRE